MPDTHDRTQAAKAVIPAAGLATRFLPATKAVPKELLPVVDRPVLQYIVEEAATAGLKDVLLITGRGKTSIIDHFDRQPYLESRLEAKNDAERLAAIMHPSELAEIYTCRQAEPLGLGHAISCAQSHVGSAPFAVLLGDEFVEVDKPVLPAMLELQARTGGIVMAFNEVDASRVSRYGVASVDQADKSLAAALRGRPGLSKVFRVTGLIEKPAPGTEPSNLAVVGRYVLPNEVFEALRRVKPGAAGEIQLTDALALMLAEGVPVHGVVYRGIWFDTGQPLGYLQAVVQIAARRPDLGPAFVDWLMSYVAGLKP